MCLDVPHATSEKNERERERVRERERERERERRGLGWGDGVGGGGGGGELPCVDPKMRPTRERVNSPVSSQNLPDKVNKTLKT